MNRLRLFPAASILASALFLAACGAEEEKVTTAPAPAPASASAAVQGETPAEATSTPATTGGGSGASDKEACEAARTAGEDMKQELIKALSSGKEPDAALFTKILTGLEQDLSAVAPASDGDVATALKSISAEAAKAAKAADPTEAAASAGFEKAGTELTAACKTVGVDVNFE